MISFPVNIILFCQGILELYWLLGGWKLEGLEGGGWGALKGKMLIAIEC